MLFKDVEKMKQYLFKLNVQPTVLKKYDADLLFNELVPNKINNAYQSLFNQVNRKEQDLSFTVEQDYGSIVYDPLYIELIEKTDNFVKDYRYITNEYKAKHGLNYSVQYLETSNVLIDMRKNY